MEHQKELFPITRLDLPAARKARDRGQKRVLDEDFVQAALDVLNESHPVGEFTGEDIRVHIENNGVQPRHPNAWGALINALRDDGLIVATGGYRQPQAKKSHGRKIQVYRWRANR